MPDWFLTLFIIGLGAVGVLVLLSVVMLPVHLWMWWDYTRTQRETSST